MMSRKKVVGIGCLVLAVGLFGGMALAIRSVGDFKANARTAPGTVVQLVTRTTYHPQVEFKTEDGRTYRFESPHGSRPSDYQVGEQVEVIYDPASPAATARIHTMIGIWFSPLLLGGLGLLFGCLGLVLILAPMLAGRRDQRLKRHGKHVLATITDVGDSPFSEVEGTLLYRVSAEYVDRQTEIKQFFNSRDLRTKPAVEAGQSISVYIDPTDENRYFVDIPVD